MGKKEWFNVDLRLINLKSYNKALKAFDKAITINPKDFRAWNNIGVYLGNVKS